MKAALAGLLIFLLLPIGSRLATPSCESLPPGISFASAVVLGGGVLGPERLGAGSAARTDAGIALVRSGVASRLIFTGDGVPGAPAVAELMRRRAERAGIAPERLAAETKSRSTLENARFTRAMTTAPLLLVTDGYHAWRSWLSFAWAGNAPDALCRAVRPAPAGPAEYLREAAVWPLNLLRAALWSGASALGRAGTLPEWFLS